MGKSRYDYPINRYQYIDQISMWSQIQRKWSLPSYKGYKPNGSSGVIFITTSYGGLKVSELQCLYFFFFRFWLTRLAFFFIAIRCNYWLHIHIFGAGTNRLYLLLSLACISALLESLKCTTFLVGPIFHPVDRVARQSITFVPTLLELPELLLLVGIHL